MSPSSSIRHMSVVCLSIYAVYDCPRLSLSVSCLVSVCLCPSMPVSVCPPWPSSVSICPFRLLSISLSFISSCQRALLILVSQFFLVTHLLFYEQQIVSQFVHFHFLSQLLKRKSPVSSVHHRWQMKILFASSFSEQNRILSPVLHKPYLHTWIGDSCFTCDGS
jgi:hypothetical protein